MTNLTIVPLFRAFELARSRRHRRYGTLHRVLARPRRHQRYGTLHRRSDLLHSFFHVNINVCRSRRIRRATISRLPGSVQIGQRSLAKNEIQFKNCMQRVGKLNDSSLRGLKGGAQFIVDRNNSFWVVSRVTSRCLSRQAILCSVSAIYTPNTGSCIVFKIREHYITVVGVVMRGLSYDMQAPGTTACRTSVHFGHP